MKDALRRNLGDEVVALRNQLFDPERLGYNVVLELVSEPFVTVISRALFRLSTYHAVLFGLLNLLQSCVGRNLSLSQLREHSYIGARHTAMTGTGLVSSPVLCHSRIVVTQVSPSIIGISRSIRTMESGMAFGPQSRANVVLLRKSKASAP